MSVASQQIGGRLTHLAKHILTAVDDLGLVIKRGNAFRNSNPGAGEGLHQVLEFVFLTIDLSCHFDNANIGYTDSAGETDLLVGFLVVSVFDLGVGVTSGRSSFIGGEFPVIENMALAVDDLVGRLVDPDVWHLVAVELTGEG